MTAAVNRRTASGWVLGAQERIDGAQALALFLGPVDRPGDPPRRLMPGAPADLCVMARPMRDVVHTLDAALVKATVIGGRVVG
jgi:predicted amidohydrolase YtcJ